MTCGDQRRQITEGPCGASGANGSGHRIRIQPLHLDMSAVSSYAGCIQVLSAGGESVWCL